MTPKTPHDRLRTLRENAGYETAADFARTKGLEIGTYRSHENGNRGIKSNAALKYAIFLTPKDSKNTAQWIMYGDGDSEVPAVEKNTHTLSSRQPFIPEVDLRAGMGGPGFSEESNGCDSSGNIITMDTQKSEGWGIPDNYLSGELHVQRSGLYVVEVQGDSMEPNLLTGDRVMVDTNDKRPRNGIFAVRDSYGVSVKSIQPIHGSEPPLIRVISDNTKYSPENWPLEDHTIIGRVVGLIRKI
ncbi:LexA family transcriptional regulator [Terasakiella sp.]|uniref:LexA family transcriptional regulator n=1 Tax=Terasakiella sp. TaxID=2034861 RepID=UPI003AA8308D